MGASDILALARDLGPFLTLMVYIIARDHHREYRLDKRVDELNTFVRDQMMKALNRNNELLSRWQIPIYPVPSAERSTRSHADTAVRVQYTDVSVRKSTC